MLPHHIAWLRNHPDRDEQWLRERLSDGFQVHHLDGNHDNNAPENLVLIAGDDHMRMHDIPVRQRHLKASKVKRDRKRFNDKSIATRLQAAEELLRQSGLVL